MCALVAWRVSECHFCQIIGERKAWVVCSFQWSGSRSVRTFAGSVFSWIRPRRRRHRLSRRRRCARCFFILFRFSPSNVNGIFDDGENMRQCFVCASESVMCILNIYRGKMLAQGEQKSEWMNEWATAWITKKSKILREKKEKLNEKAKTEAKKCCEKMSGFICASGALLRGSRYGRNNNVHRQEWRAKWRYKEAEAEDMAISDSIQRFSVSSER